MMCKQSGARETDGSSAAKTDHLRDALLLRLQPSSANSAACHSARSDACYRNGS